MTGSARALVCPSCGAERPPDERFCPDCGMPLVHGAGVEEPVSELRERARKIDPRYVAGELVRVATARNQPEAELIQGLLLEEGVPSVLRRSRGFDIPDFLAAGPRDVLVAQSGAAPAREILLQAEIAPAGTAPGPAPVRVLALLLAALGVVALIIWVAIEVLA